jgi:acetyl esterase
MDPEVKALLEMMAAASAGAPKLWEMDPQSARQMMDAQSEMMNAGAPEMASIVDRAAPGPLGEVPVKVFTPKGAGPFPLLVYIHGGGFVLGSPATHARLTSLLAEGAGCVVVSVDYRLAPEFPAPAAIGDCVAAIEWALANGKELNADVSRYAIGGDSAGGNLTAAACLKLRDTGRPLPRLQYLIYGAFDFDTEKPSFKQNGEGYMLENEAIRWFMQQYVQDESCKTDPYVAPNSAESLAGLPPAFLQVGTLDPLLDDSFVYGNRLARAGVPVTIAVYQDQIHGFLQMDAMLTGARRAVADGIAALKAALS